MMTKTMLVIVTFMTTTLIGGVAYAQGDPDIGGTLQTFLGMIMQGKYLPAVGAVLILLVAGARWGLGRWVPWFKTKAGGYVLGFGSAALLYLGTAWEAGAPMSIGLLTAALAAGWTSAGGYEPRSDLIGWLRGGPKTNLPVAVSPPGIQQGSPGAAASAAIVLLGVTGCLALGAGMMQACGPVHHAGVVIIDCVEADAAQTAALLDELKPILAGRPISWSAIEDKAIAAGETVGGCVLATLVQEYLGGTKATPTDNSWQARSALEDARTKWNPAIVWRTRKGDL